MDFFNNKKRVVQRAIVSAVASSLIAFNSFASTSEDYEKALTAFNQNEYDEAYIHLKNSLQKDPENLAAKILMGDGGTYFLGFTLAFLSLVATRNNQNFLVYVF